MAVASQRVPSMSLPEQQQQQMRSISGTMLTPTQARIQQEIDRLGAQLRADVANTARQDLQVQERFAQWKQRYDEEQSAELARHLLEVEERYCALLDQREDEAAQLRVRLEESVNTMRLFERWISSLLDAVPRGEGEEQRFLFQGLRPKPELLEPVPEAAELDLPESMSSGSIHAALIAFRDSLPLPDLSPPALPVFADAPEATVPDKQLRTPEAIRPRKLTAQTPSPGASAVQNPSSRQEPVNLQLTESVQPGQLTASMPMPAVAVSQQQPQARAATMNPASRGSAAPSAAGFAQSTISPPARTLPDAPNTAQRKTQYSMRLNPLLPLADARAGRQSPVRGEASSPRAAAARVASAQRRRALEQRLAAVEASELSAAQLQQHQAEADVHASHTISFESDDEDDRTRSFGQVDALASSDVRLSLEPSQPVRSTSTSSSSSFLDAVGPIMNSLSSPSSSPSAFNHYRSLQPLRTPPQVQSSVFRFDADPVAPAHVSSGVALSQSLLSGTTRGFGLEPAPIELVVQQPLPVAAPLTAWHSNAAPDVHADADADGDLHFTMAQPPAEMIVRRRGPQELPGLDVHVAMPSEIPARTAPASAAPVHGRSMPRIQMAPRSADNAQLRPLRDEPTTTVPRALFAAFKPSSAADMYKGGTRMPAPVSVSFATPPRQLRALHV